MNDDDIRRVGTNVESGDDPFLFVRKVIGEVVAAPLFECNRFFVRCVKTTTLYM